MSCNGNPEAEIQDRDLNEVSEAVQTNAEPFAMNIEKAKMDKDHYGEVRWTREYMQLVFMSL